MIDFERFCRDYHIPTAPVDHKHSRPGWINVSCPFCIHNPGFHLGYNDNGYFFCWSCGKKWELEVLAKLARCPMSQAEIVRDRYNVSGHRRKRRTGEIKRIRKFAGFPPSTGEMAKLHRNYLRSRKYDPEHLEEVWGLLGTGPVGRYKFRIIAPITFCGEVVSYQGRDATGKQTPPYKACSKEDEAMDHKHCLYGMDLVEKSAVVVVEGVADAWRMGPGAVATFGIGWTQPQARLLATFEQVFLLYDFEPEAQSKARALAETISVLGGRSVEIVSGPGSGDPGELPQAEADAIMQELLG